VRQGELEATTDRREHGLGATPRRPGQFVMEPADGAPGFGLALGELQQRAFALTRQPKLTDVARVTAIGVGAQSGGRM
jgi:hypothetical protein